MSINLSYRRLSQSELQEVLDGVPTAYKKWFGPLDLTTDDADDEFERMHEWLDASGQYLSITNAWQAIHFLLTGEFCFQGDSQTPPPLGNVVMGGTPTDIKTTYGVAYYLTPQEVADAAHVLEPLPIETLAPRYDAARFREAEIYPGHENWDDDGMEDYGVDTDYENLRAFFLLAARENQAMFLASY